MEVAGWRIWYDNGMVFWGTTFSDWEKLPEDGVLFLVLYQDKDTSQGIPYMQRLSGHDHYFATPSGIYGSSNDEIDSIHERYEDPSIKRGRWAPLEVFEAVRAEAEVATERPDGR